MRLSLYAFLCVVLALPMLVRGADSLQIARLRCDDRDEPMGIDSPQPRLSWVLSSGARGQRQTAYQIEVASSAQRLTADTPDVWDSGRVVSDESIHVAYA